MYSGPPLILRTYLQLQLVTWLPRSVIAVGVLLLAACAQTTPKYDVVVSTGFMNLHSHSVAELGYRVDLLAGVTTVLEPDAGGVSFARPPYSPTRGIHSFWVAGQLSMRHGQLIEGTGAGQKLIAYTR